MMLWEKILSLLTIVLISVCVAQWQEAPQWERAARVERAPHQSFYDNADCPDYPGNKPPPEYCPPDHRWGPCGCYKPPFWPFDPITVEIPGVGFVIGRSMEYRYNQRYINFFLGIPYARRIQHERRFMAPEPPGPGWDEGVREWDASYYRDACPQEIWHLQDRFYEPRNFSEDCLHINVFMPNITDYPPSKRNFEVLVFIHGDDYKMGDSMMYPGHLLAKKEVVVVTFNYRLGALGFLSTLPGDDTVKGNVGLMDIIMALKWIQTNIQRFHGNPNEVTLVGHGSGAAAISLLLLSPKSREGSRQLFHQVILMSGTDMCEWSFVDKLYITPWDRSDPLEFAKDLGRTVGCDPDYGDFSIVRMVECLRAKHYDEIVNASASISKKYGMLWGPFGPVVDGEGGFLPKTPTELRKEGNFMKVKLIAGLTKDQGAYLAENATRSVKGIRIGDGIDPYAFRKIIEDIIRPRIGIKNQEEVVGAIEFEYTFWAKPDNKSAVRQNLVDLYSDMIWGSCTDAVLKQHMVYDEPVYMYIFAHRSDYEYLPFWMGAPYGKDVDYLFGHPFFNETLGNITGVVPDQWDWTILDKNMSDFMMSMFVNFTKFGLPTTEWVRNVTWYPLRPYNLSYLHVGEISYMDINYRQSHYAFWKEYFPQVSDRFPLTTTPFPTPEPLLQYQVATWSLFGVAIVTLFIIAALGITLWRKTRSDDDYMR